MAEDYGIIWVKPLHELRTLAKRGGERAERVYQS